MKKNIVPLVVIALVVAILSTGIFYGLIVSRMDGSSPPVAVPRFVAAKTLEKGRAIVATDFRLAAAADPGVPTPTRAEDLIGRRLMDKVEEGRVFVEELLSPVAERGLSSGVPQGMRAVTIHVSDSSSVIQLLGPGDRVDVQSLISRPRNGEADMELRTLLQNATVFNVISEVNAQGQAPARAVLTLLSSPQDAERLAVADAGARLRVVLRNRSDQGIVPLGTTSLLNLGAVPKPVVTSSFLAGPTGARSVGARNLAEPVELEVSLLEMSAEQMSALVPDLKTGTLTVMSSSLQQNLSERVLEMRKSNLATLLASSRIVAGKSGEFEWQASGQASMRVQVEPLATALDGTSSLRVRPESSLSQAGTMTTRRADSNVQVKRNQGVLVGGLFPSEQVAQLREKLRPGVAAGGGELVMLITPIHKN